MKWTSQVHSEFSHFPTEETLLAGLGLKNGCRLSEHAHYLCLVRRRTPASLWTLPVTFLSSLSPFSFLFYESFVFSLWLLLMFISHVSSSCACCMLYFFRSSFFSVFIRATRSQEYELDTLYHVLSCLLRLGLDDSKCWSNVSFFKSHSVVGLVIRLNCPSLHLSFVIRWNVNCHRCWFFLHISKCCCVCCMHTCLRVCIHLGLWFVDRKTKRYSRS